MPDFPELPIIEPFTIPSSVNWTYIDRRELDGRDYKIVTDLWCESADARLRELPGRIPVCRQDGTCGALFIEDGVRSLRRARILRPGLTFQQFEAEGGGRQRETDPIATKPQLFFGIRQGRDWIGGMPMSNITIEFQDRNKIEASFFIPTAPAIPRMTRARSNSLGIRWLLNNDLPMRDGRVLDLVQWDFTLPKALEVALRADPSIMENIVELGSEFVRKGGVGSDDEDVKLTFRRRNTRPAPDEVEPPVDTTEPPRDRPDPIRRVTAIVDGGGGSRER